jgi:hypothetical protein
MPTSAWSTDQRVRFQICGAHLHPVSDPFQVDAAFLIQSLKNFKGEAPFSLR